MKRVWGAAATSALLMGLVSCSSTRLGLRSQVKAPVVFQDSSIELTRKPQVPHLESKGGAWQWRSIFALGAPAQSMVEPISLGGGEWIVATLGGGVGRWNLEKGFSRWQIEVESGVAARPLATSSALYFAGMDATLRKVNLNNGDIIWSKKLSAESLGGIALNGGFLYVNTADDTLLAVDEKTGNVLWKYQRPSKKANIYWSLRGQAVPTLSKDGKSLYVGFSDGVFVAFEAISGTTLWERKFEQVLRVSDVDMTAALSPDQTRVYMVHADGALYALNAADGAVLWTMPNAAASSPLLDPQGAYVYQGTRHGELRKLNAKNGSVQWSRSYDNPGHISSVRLADNGILVFSGSHAGIYFVDSENGKLVHHVKTGVGPIAPVALEGERIFVVSPRNNLLRFRFAEDKRADKGT